MFHYFKNRLVDLKPGMYFARKSCNDKVCICFTPRETLKPVTDGLFLAPIYYIDLQSGEMGVFDKDSDYHKDVILVEPKTITEQGIVWIEQKT